MISISVFYVFMKESMWNIFLRSSHFEIMLMEMLTDMQPAGRSRRGVARMKKHSLKTDMTPMVDLGFLLIAFFIMTTELNKPVVTRLNMPHDGPSIPLAMSNALTVLLGDNNTVYYYH